MIDAVLKRLSICPCGFPVLNEDIPLGTKYQVDPDRTDTFTFICGGCYRRMEIIGVWVERGGTGGYLPKEIFEGP